MYIRSIYISVVFEKSSIFCKSAKTQRVRAIIVVSVKINEDAFFLCVIPIGISYECEFILTCVVKVLINYNTIDCKWAYEYTFD